MFEHKTEPLLPWKAFKHRMTRRVLWALLFLGGSLALGTLGFWALAGQAFIDALLNSAMLLGGMGPVGDIKGIAGKLFATVFALYAGLAFLGIVGFVGAPMFHRLLHKFHLEEHKRAPALKGRPTDDRT